MQDVLLTPMSTQWCRSKLGKLVITAPPFFFFFYGVTEAD